MSESIVAPQLPQEIWGRILSFNDKTHLWMTCRKVSKAWRNDAEHIFANKIIKDVYIKFDCGSTRYKHSTWFMAMPMTFDRFSEDKSLAYFKDCRKKPKKRNKRPDRIEDLEVRNWINSINWQLGGNGPTSSERGSGRFDLPGHIITIGAEVNDTELPKLEY